MITFSYFDSSSFNFVDSMSSKSCICCICYFLFFNFAFIAVNVFLSLIKIFNHFLFLLIWINQIIKFIFIFKILRICIALMKRSWRSSFWFIFQIFVLTYFNWSSFSFNLLLCDFTIFLPHLFQNLAFVILYCIIVLFRLRVKLFL